MGFYYFSFLVLLFGTITKAQKVPSMYVFGDSLIDVGNNNHLPLSILKANLPHNGIDSPRRLPTGRFSNGKNAADFIAEKLGLPTAPPYLSNRDNTFVKGVSFASGGAGIVNSTNENIIRQTIPMARQVGYFSNVQQRLVKEMGNAAAAEEHLAKSIIAIVIGSNDIINYFDNGSDEAKMYSPQQFVTMMISNLKQHLKGIHGLGGRKFLVVGVPTVGCAPKQRLRSPTNECNEEVNEWTKKFNNGLTQILSSLKVELNQFHYTYFDAYGVLLDIIQNPAMHGFTEIKSACCGSGKLRAELPCTPIALFCPNRNANVFWDIYHPTEAAARVVIDKLFGSSYVSPMTLDQLISI